MTLDGDLRHREATSEPVSRAAFEARLIAAKYPPGPQPVAGTMTDTDDEVAELALKMIESNLRTGAVVISRESVPICRACGHMTGRGSHACRACGNSGTRDHGIDLSAFGLTGLVLDPRVGVHVTVLAAARRYGAEKAMMTIPQNAANPIPAHGQHFRRYRGTRLQYALHGHLPYAHMAELRTVYEAYRATDALQRTFETWFLPLFSLKERGGTHPEQLPQLFKHFMRAHMARPGEPAPSEIDAVRQAVAEGRTYWITSKRGLATAMAAASQSVCCGGSAMRS